MLQDSYNHIVWHPARVTRPHREALNRHRGAILWFTGLSGAGKSTIAHEVEARLHEQQCRTFVLDGDNIRHGLSRDLGFSETDRRENIRRIAEVAKLMLEAGSITLTAFISPFRLERELARSTVAAGDFIEIYCRCDVTVCERRDVKGLYRKARLGQLAEFTGISSPYEAPLGPELILDTETSNLDECVEKVLNYLRTEGILKG